ncbi:FAD binding domain-containing protein [Roseovarius sp. SYSU LYC5161]|uniref:FAD binding domain-containing protein n=1 Tax=Roseovarius halophilus (ex Wu et al. 2025) TaxID=3376060 RepID=UPI00287275D2|nr:xanthine dehydrogenase family protein subunit M [Roseovarius sp.]
MQYHSPKTVDDAVRLLAAEAGECRVLAGGTDLLVRMRSGMSEPDSILDIKRIDELRRITREDGGWRIGAAVSGAEMGENDALVADWPGVVEAVNLIGSTQIQGRCTLAGNLCNASPAADSVPAMVAADGVARVAGPDGQRDLPVQDIPTGPGKTSLKRGEFITSIFLPSKAERSGDAYLRFIPRTEMDIAVVGCGVSLTLDADGTCIAARVALGAVAPTVILVEDAAKTLVGTRADDAALDALAAACSTAATPIADKRGTEEFRVHVAGVLAKRAAKIARNRAGGAT